MRNILILTKILFKNVNFEVMESRNKANKKRSSIIGKIALFLLLLYSFIAIAFVIYSISYLLIKSFVPIGLQLLGLEMILVAVSAIIFLFGILMVPTVFYFSDDVQNLLPLPLKPYEIFSAKFLVTLLYEYLALLVLYIPIILAYVVNVKVDLLFYIQSFVLGLLLPILPLLLAMLFIMVLMRFSKIMRNRDRFNIIIGVIYVFLILIFSSGMNQINQETAENFISIISNNQNIFGIISQIVPNISFAIKGLANNDFISFGISIMIPIVSFILVTKLTDYLYFGGIIGINETGAKRKKISQHDINRSIKNRNILWTYTKKELAILFRTPIYFLNCILSNYMAFIFLGISLMITNLNDTSFLLELEAIVFTLRRLDISYYTIDWIFIALASSIVAAIISTISNNIAVTSLSREGKNIWFMKSIPVSYRTQIDAKVLSSIIIGSTASLPILFLAIWLFNLPFFYIFIAIIGNFIGSICFSYIAILVDILRPKLSWDNEKVAIKNNINILIVFALAASYIGLTIIITIKYSIPILIASITFTVITLLLAIFIYLKIPSIANKRFENF